MKSGLMVVADTSPLNYLILLGHADVLHAIYGRVLVPPAVLVEMRHAEAPISVRQWAESPPAWLEETRVEKIDITLRSDLGAGEREAISLAAATRADVLLMDERVGRQEAESRQIAVAGTLAICLQASMLGHLDFPEALKRLREEGFRVSGKIEAEMSRRYKEAMNSRAKSPG